MLSLDTDLNALGDFEQLFLVIFELPGQFLFAGLLARLPLLEAVQRYSFLSR
jgi:hypothetical protein